MKLILITPPEDLFGEIDTSNFFLSLGYQLHIRKPQQSTVQIRRFVQNINTAYLNQCAVHGIQHLGHIPEIEHFHLKSNEEVDFDKSPQHYLYSKSVHSFSTLVKEEKKKYEYLFLSPIYNSISKPGYYAAFDKKLLKQKLSTIRKTIPIIALGGINEQNMNAVMEMGFDGAAFLGSIWSLPFKERIKVGNRILKMG